MTNFTTEMIEKAKAAKSAEELLALAKENEIEMTEEEAVTYFDQLNPKSGELSDEELENVAGGGPCDSPEEKFPEGCKVFWKGGVCGERTTHISGNGVERVALYCRSQKFYLHWIDPGKTYQIRCAFECNGTKTFSGDPADRGFERL